MVKHALKLSLDLASGALHVARDDEYARATIGVEFLSRFGVENRVFHPHTEGHDHAQISHQEALGHEVTGLAPLPPAMKEWERVLVEPVLLFLFEAPKAPTTEPKEMRDGEAN